MRCPSKDGDDCSKGLWRGERLCGYPMERVRMATAERQCADRGLELCARLRQAVVLSRTRQHSDFNTSMLLMCPRLGAPRGLRV